MYFIIWQPISLGPILLFFLVTYLMFGDTSWIFDYFRPGLYFFLFMLTIVAITFLCISFASKNKKLLFLFLPLWIFLTNITTLVYKDTYYRHLSTEIQNIKNPNTGYEPSYLSRLFKGINSEIILIEPVNGIKIHKIEAENTEITQYKNCNAIVVPKDSLLTYFDITYYETKQKEVKAHKKRVYLPNDYKRWLCNFRGFTTNYCTVGNMLFDGDNCYLTVTEKNRKNTKFWYDSMFRSPGYSEKQKIPCWYQIKWRNNGLKTLYQDNTAAYLKMYPEDKIEIPASYTTLITEPLNLR